MKKADIRYMIEDYCSWHEIEINEEQLSEAVDHIAERVEDWEEYNARCGIHSVNVDMILESYFEDFEEEQNHV